MEQKFFDSISPSMLEQANKLMDKAVPGHHESRRERRKRERMEAKAARRAAKVKA